MVLPVAQGNPLILERGQRGVENRKRRFLSLRSSGYRREQREKRKPAGKTGR
jgi:hypothetical protein